MNSFQAKDKSKEDFSKLFETMDLGVVYQDAEGSIITANPAAEKILGLSLDQMLGRTSMHPEWKAIDKDGLSLPGDQHAAMVALRTREKVSNVLQGIYNPQIKDYVWILVNSVPQFHKGSKEPYQVYSTFLDITERKKNQEQLQTFNQKLQASEQQLLAANQQLRAHEQQLRASNQQLQQSEFKYRSLFNSMQEGLYLHSMVYDNKGKAINYRIIEANSVSEKYLNIKREDAIGKLATELYGTAEAPFLTEYAKVAKTGIPITFEQYFAPMDKHFLISVFSPKEGDFATLFLDISNSKKTEQALIKAKEKVEENEEKFKKLFNNVNDAIFIYNPDNFEILEANKATSEMYGYDHNELIGMSCLKFSAEVEKSKSIAKLIRNNKEGKINVELRHHQKKDGTPIFVELSTFNILVNGENITYSVCHDITNQKLAQEKIREQDMKFSKLSANVPDLIFQFTRRPDGSYYVPIASEGIKNIFGCSPEDVIDSFDAIARVLHPEDAERVISDIEYSAKHLTYFTCEFRVQIPGRPIQWIFSRSTPEKLDDGSITWYGFNMNITERKKAEQALKESESKLKYIIENSTNLFYSHTPDHEITFISPQVREVLQYEPEEAKRRWTDFITDNPMNEQGIKFTERAIKTGKRQPTYELELTRKDGKNIVVEVRETPVIQNKKVVAIVGSLVDITERKKYEKELTQAKEKAEESDRLKSAFLANMSHEIRTPMNGILGFTSILKEADLSGDERSKYIEIIEKSGERMLGTINDIIDFSRIESGEVKVRIKPSNINSQLESLYDFFKPEADKRKLKFLYKSDLDNAAAEINTDPEKLHAIFTNLIKNALKFTNKGSVEFGYSHVDKHIHCYVKDTGQGIGKEKLESIFERFVQEDDTYTRTQQGSGLGLSIVKAYVQLLEGKIWVESVKGEGSTFRFMIPYKPYKKVTSITDPDVRKTKDGKTSLTNKTILIVEDDNSSFEYLEVVLTSFGVNNIKLAKTGEKAIKQCKENPEIDLVLMDINLPVMNGYEATKAIKDLRPNLPIIAQTAYALTGDREKSINAGCDDYITKPIKKEVLFKKIKKYLD